MRLNIPPGKYCTCACKMQILLLFSTSAEEYEAKMPQYFLYEQQVVHQSSMIPMYYMWAPITVHCLCNMCRSVEDWILIIVEEFELSVTSDTWLYWFCFGFISFISKHYSCHRCKQRDKRDPAWRNHLQGANVTS